MSQVVASVGAATGNNIQAFIDLTVLNCKLRGVYQYQVIKVDETTNEKRTQILVMPTDAEPQEMTLLQLISEINKIIEKFGKGKEVTVDSMSQTLDSMGLSSIKDITVQIRQLFIYVDNSSIPENTKPVEYAFNFVIRNQVKPDKSFELFHLNSLGIAVYNTDRKKVIERMELQDINALLN